MWRKDTNVENISHIFNM
jgi:hypothetical protein